MTTDDMPPADNDLTKAPQGRNNGSTARTRLVPAPTTPRAVSQPHRLSHPAFSRQSLPNQPAREKHGASKKWVPLCLDMAIIEQITTWLCRDMQVYASIYAS